MTEAMSRREIEDILSSIRKLVTHDPARVAEAARSAPKPDTGKLVLTSALRVDTAVTDGSDGPVPEIHFPARAIQPEDDAASLLARITRSVPREPVETAPAPIAITPPLTDNIDAPPKTATISPEPAEAAPLTQTPVLQDWLDDADIPLDPAPQTMTEEAEVSETPAVAELDPALEETLAPLTMTEDAEVSETPAVAELDPALEETLARLEAALSGQPVEQATVSLDDTTATTTARDASDDTPVIDEAMLYQLVANIVRQELQGELGEKITRAIRKLVRAEVARELQLRGH
jgi:hypothetical protein